MDINENAGSKILINDNLLIPGLKKVAKSTCKIINGNKTSTGFLVSLPINIGNRYLYGLMTNNQSLSDKEIKVGNKLNLYFEESKQNLTFIIPEGSFIFSCPLLDVTFVEIPQGTFQNVDYLRVCESPIEGQKIYIIKYSSEGDLSHVEGNILNYYGTDFTFNISEGNDEKEFYGSAIISLSKISLGDVLGLDKGIFLIKNAKNKLATNINVILDAIRCLTHRNMVNPKETLPPARKLVNEDLTILSNKGLQPTDNPYIFISPSSLFITPLWFYRTQYSWYWTPKEPQNYSMDEIKKCNWSLIKENRPITAIGGMYHNTEPAERNIILIKYLIDSHLYFLKSD